MDDTDKKIAEIERELCVYDYGIDKEDAEWLIDQLRECREENSIMYTQLDDERGPRRDEALDEEAGNIIKDCYQNLEKAMVDFKGNMNRALDLEYAAGQSQMKKRIADQKDSFKQAIGEAKRDKHED